MPSDSHFPLRNLVDIKRFEQEKPFSERCSCRSVYDIFVQSAQRFPDKAALTLLMTGQKDETPREITYSQLLEGVTKAANFFTSIAGPVPAVAFMLPSLIETHFVLWGAESAGYALPINFLLQPEHISHLIKAADIKVLVTLGPHPQLDIWEKALAVAERVPGLKLVQIGTPGSKIPDGVIDFFAGMKEQDGSRMMSANRRMDDEVAAYFHTGGTTGAPKLATHTHRNQLVAAYGGKVLLDVSETDTMMAGLPLFHVAGTIIGALSMFMGGVRLLILSPGGMRNPLMIQNFWKIIEHYKATISGGVPTVMSALLNVPVDGADISSVRLAITGAAAAPKAVVEQYEEMGNFKVHDVFGMTECGGLVCVQPSAGERVIGSVGYRLPYINTAVRRLNDDGSLGGECAPHEIGVLTISGPVVTPGYRGETGNSDAIQKDFLNSGDLAYTDETGRVYIAGRAKDLIIRSGHNIDPQLIENVLQDHPAVAVAAAVGLPDKYAGELPVCYVSLKPGVTVTPEELKAFAEPLIAERPAWPKQIFVVDAIPVTSVGKIFKPQLRTDAVRRVVAEAVTGVTGSDGAAIEVSAGGKRGIDVRVTLPAAQAAQKAAAEKALEGYLFDYKVVVAS